MVSRPVPARVMCEFSTDQMLAPIVKTIASSVKS